jgi:hypothetical protein
LALKPKEDCEAQQYMLSFTDWAISQTVATMVELGIQDKCGYSNNGSLALRFKSGPSSSPSSSEKKS